MATGLLAELGPEGGEHLLLPHLPTHVGEEGGVADDPALGRRHEPGREEGFEVQLLVGAVTRHGVLDPADLRDRPVALANDGDPSRADLGLEAHIARARIEDARRALIGSRAHLLVSALECLELPIPKHADERFRAIDDTERKIPNSRERKAGAAHFLRHGVRVEQIHPPGMDSVPHHFVDRKVGRDDLLFGGAGAPL